MLHHNRYAAGPGGIVSATDLSHRLAGRRALVTGAGSGIGRASALRLAAEGAAVAVVDVRAGSAEMVVAELEAAGGKAVALTADVREEEAVRGAAAEAVAALGGLDTVVACAGIVSTGATDAMSLEQWNLMLGVNLTGVFLTLKHTLPHLVEAGRSSIVTIGSVASLVAAGRTPAYDASKGGVLQFTRAIAVEYADRGVRANCVCPGVVNTNLAASSRSLNAPVESDVGPWTRLRPPQSRAADPSEIASVVLFLCSDDASFVTGAAIAADGGYTAI
jgi:NAD(P)-dependent dehydrogenase (short-subunit alcohol dehydrogenase family)